MDEIKRTRRPSTPGLILRTSYLEQRGIGVTAMAEALEVSRKQLSLMLNGHARVTPQLAGRLAKVLGTTSRFWLNLQAAVDAYEADQLAKDWQPGHPHAA